MFRKRTVTAVVAGFNAMLNQLDKVVVQNEAIAEINSSVIATLAAESAAADIETLKAKRIRAKIAAIIEE